jgi:hypothetical protein
MKAELPLRGRTEISSLQGHQRSGATREAVFWRATYAYKSNGFTYTDEASIRDVLRGGCGIRGRTRLAEGTNITLTLYLMDHLRPLSVAAVVSWVAGEFFGVKFLGLSEGKYQRLQRYMQQMLGEFKAEPEEVSPIKKVRRNTGLGLTVYLVLLGALWGCGTLPPPISAPSAPFLVPTADDRVNLALRASELDVIAVECAPESTCNEQVHFARALVSLFENREAARVSFEKVISLNPSGVLASSSTLWLQVLSDEAHPLDASYRPFLIELTTQWAREWMARPLAVKSCRERTLDVPKPALVQVLSQQVRERDRHIADLRAQLDALKVINHDQEERRKMRPPASIVPKFESSR